MLVEIPYVRRMLEERTRAVRIRVIREVLDERLGPLPGAISNSLPRARGEEALRRLTRSAATCRSLEEFANALFRELSSPVRPRPLPLWNAAAAGRSAQAMTEVLRKYSKFPLPANLGPDLAEIVSRYGRVRLEKHDGPSDVPLLRMTCQDVPLLEELARQPKL